MATKVRTTLMAPADQVGIVDAPVYTGQPLEDGEADT